VWDFGDNGRKVYIPPHPNRPKEIKGVRQQTSFLASDAQSLCRRTIQTGR